ncbi:MAG: spermidine/putrescine ABC transporter substrate-binding protein [Amphritea sp.]
MHRLIYRQLSRVTVFLLCCIPLASLAAERQLIILNWSDYIDPALIAKFGQRYDARVREVYYSSDDNRTEMLQENNAEDYDLILTSDSDLYLYAKRQWIAPLDYAKIPNMKHIAPRWIDAFEAAGSYAVPYFLGTTGIVYRSDLVKTPITSWQQLFRPEPELQGKIAMVRDSRDIIGMGLKALGYSANSSDRNQLKEVEALLLKQKQHVRTYNYINLDETSAILSGEIVASLMYSGDALMVAEHNEDLRYVVPQEGGNIWVDYFTLGGKAKNVDLAYAFLNFINEPENAAQMAQYVYYATPNRAAEVLLPPEFLTDPVIYPDQARLESSEFYVRQAPKSLRLRNSISASVFR